MHDSHSHPRAPRLRALIVGRTRMDTVPLSEVGTLSIGSAAGSDVVIDDPSVAAHHAVLNMGPPLSIVDLGSGSTTAGGKRLSAGEGTPISPGMVVMLGGVTMILQSSGTSSRLRHVRSHDYFQGRVEEECARVDQRGGSFAIARLDLPPGRGARAEGPIASSMRPMDVLATYTPEQYELLLLDVDPQQAESIVDDLLARIRSAGEAAVTAIAAYPRDARTPDALFALLDDALLGSSKKPADASILAADGAMARLRLVVERVAKGPISVLVLGETGVGKEVMAKTIHAHSPRSAKPLLCLNCAAVSEMLLESELFGYERGAFTGAVQSKAGLLETADGGTIFLDEVGDMPASVQARLLRVIEQKEVTRLGALTPRTIDVRFIAATNRDLEDDIASGAFRRDLYFRINGFTLCIPPLRERIDEIESLASTFIAEAAHYGERATSPRLSPEALRALQRYTWPGNIRELRNTIQRAVLLCGGGAIELSHLPLENMGRTVAIVAPTPVPSPAAERDSERERILATLERCGGNQTKAAETLGIARGTLIARIAKYGVPRPKKAAP